MNDNTKKLGLILSGIVLVIIVFILIYFITYLFKIDKETPNITTTTTKRIDDGFRELSQEEKISFNEHFNDDNLLKSFNNSYENDFNKKDVNLLESEENKFKFIYTYISLNKISNKINHTLINEYSQKIFKTDLYEGNFQKYLKDGYYEYEIKYNNLEYCLKVNKVKENVLLIDMISREENNCDINLIDYDKTLVVHQLKVTYEIINNDYIYKSFMILN